MVVVGVLTGIVKPISGLMNKYFNTVKLIDAPQQLTPTNVTFAIDEKTKSLSSTNSCNVE